MKKKQGMTAILAGGFDYLASLLDKDIKIAAINLSMGFYLDETPEQMKNDVVYRIMKTFDSMDKILLIVSAGNEGIEAGQPAPFDDPSEKLKGDATFKKGQYEYPASFTGIRNMIVVGAIDSGDNASDFTCWGDKVDIAAPGTGIYSTYSPEAEDNAAKAIYKYESGTSMAAPFVTGAAALLMSRYPNATPTQIKNAILSGANGNINPVVHPFSYEEQLKSLADSLPFRIQYKDIEELESKLETISQTLSKDFVGDVKELVEVYSQLDGKGKVSRTGLLDVKAALDVLADEFADSEPGDIDIEEPDVNTLPSSSGGCSAGFFAAALILIPVCFVRQRKK